MAPHNQHIKTALPDLLPQRTGICQLFVQHCRTKIGKQPQRLADSQSPASGLLSGGSFCTGETWSYPLRWNPSAPHLQPLHLQSPLLSVALRAHQWTHRPTAPLLYVISCPYNSAVRSSTARPAPRSPARFRLPVYIRYSASFPSHS